MHLADLRNHPRPYKPVAAGGALYIRPLYFGSGPNLLLSPPKEFTFLVWVTPCGSLYGAGKGPLKGMKAWVLDDFDRSAPMGSGSAKLAGNYAPVCERFNAAAQTQETCRADTCITTVRHAAKAKAAGYGITLHR